MLAVVYVYKLREAPDAPLEDALPTGAHGSGRASLYADCVELLNADWGRYVKRGRASVERDEQAVDELARFQEAVALAMFDAADAGGELRVIAAPALGEHFAGFFSTMSLDEVLTYCRESNGVLVAQSSREFGFLHPSFQDYFAARALCAAGENGAQRLARHADGDAGSWGAAWEWVLDLSRADRPSPFLDWLARAIEVEDVGALARGWDRIAALHRERHVPGEAGGEGGAARIRTSAGRISSSFSRKAGARGCGGAG